MEKAAADKKAMEQDLLRVKDLMNALDKDQDGNCTKDEFRQVLPLLGFDGGGSAAIDALFDGLDTDGSGAVDFEELHAQLRKVLGDADREEEEAAAIKMQAMQRGRASRKRRSFADRGRKEA